MFLTNDSGINSGWMIGHVTSAALTSENKGLAQPASIDSIPTSADQEDHVSMGPISAKKLGSLCENLESVLAIELIAASQGIHLLRPLKTSPILEEVLDQIQAVCPPWDGDRNFTGDIERVADLIRKGTLLETASAQVGAMEL